MFTHGDTKEPLTLENTMWQNTILASQAPTLGIVVYTGADTRFVMNIRQASTKCCLLDEEVNYLSKILFCFLLGLSFLITALNGFHGHWQMFFFRIMLLMSSIIPISVRINLDLAKLYYCHHINNDEDIPGVIARNSNIPEELGRIQFLISDKTGTLTQNDMITRKIYTEYSQFSYKDNKKEMFEMIGKSCYNYPKGVAADYYESGGEMKTKKREEEQVLRDMLAALALCNNVTPVVKAEPLPQEKLTPA
jgi:phospholipid-translocating ATPase